MTKEEFFEIWHKTFNKERLAAYMNDNKNRAEEISKEQDIDIWSAWNIILKERMKNFIPGRVISA